MQVATMGKRCGKWVAAAFLALWSVQAASAGEAYYLLMFGSQTIPADPNKSHSWATFVRATWEGDNPCPTNPTIEAHTISWLPANLVIRVCALCPEAGANLDLIPTMSYVLSQCERVSMWGPYKIDCELYRRALAQIDVLNSGQIQYKALDSFRNTGRVSNCIHAVSAVAQGYRLRVFSPAFGETASYGILLRFRPWIQDRETEHYWVSSALGLDAFPIIYRDFEGPHSGAILGPINRALGGERNVHPTYGPPR